MVRLRRLLARPRRQHPFKTPREPSREPRIFTTVEVEAMLHAAEPRDRLILELLLETGLRASELCTLDVSDFPVDHPDGPYLDVRSGKGEKQRAIPLTASLTRKLRRYLAHGRPSTWSSALFVTERSRHGTVPTPQPECRGAAHPATWADGPESKEAVYRHIPSAIRLRRGQYPRAWTRSVCSAFWATRPSPWSRGMCTSGSRTSSGGGIATSRPSPVFRGS